MADGGPPAPQPPPVIPPVALPLPPVQLPAPPTKLIQPGPMPQLNWSHFKLNLNSQVNQMKMQKYIFLGLMTGWTPMHF